jgi:hypothetical protein
MADTPAASVPPAQLIQRSPDGIAGYLFLLLDDLAAGKQIDMARINATCKLANTMNGQIRTAIALERVRLAGAKGIVIDHQSNGAEPPQT